MNNENNNNLNNGFVNSNPDLNGMNNNPNNNVINPMDQVVIPETAQMENNVVQPAPEVMPVNNGINGNTINPNIQNIGGVINPQPVTPVQPMLAQNNVPVEPVQQSIPNQNTIDNGNYTAQAVNNMNQNNTGMNVGVPNNGNLGMNPNPQPMPAFDNPNNIGTIPPNNNIAQPINNKKQKKGMNKTLFIILIIGLLGAVGAGVYWYLSLPKTPDVTIETKDITYELNEEISTSVEDYATIKGTNASNCTLNTDKIDTTKIGQYEYTITCGTLEKTGKALVGDTKAPIVSLVTVYKKINDELKPEDFIGICSDTTECKYEFEDESTATTLTSTAGENISVNLIVKDESENEIKVEGKLNVITSGIRAYYECTSKEQNLEDLNATMTLTHSLGILDTNAADGKLAFGNFGTQKVVYKFTDAEQFDNLQKEFKEKGIVTINNIEGIADFDKENMTITMISDIDLSNLKTQYGEESFVSYGTIKPLYETTLGYTCRTK